MFDILKNYLTQSDELTSEMIESISKCEFDILEKTINRLYTQASCEFVEPSHSDYICNLINSNSNPELYINYKEKYNPKLWNGVIQTIYGDNLALKMFSIDSMTDYLQINSTNRYLFIPILLSSAFGENEIRSNHTCLIFDYLLSEVYFFDPNGWTKFFDKNTEINNITVIEKIFSKYFDDLNIYSGIKFKYISVFEWNNSNTNINPLNSNTDSNTEKNKTSNIIQTIIFCHYCCLSQKTVQECLIDFAELNDQDKQKLYDDYTVGFYHELKQTENVDKINVDKIEQNNFLSNYENYENYKNYEQEQEPKQGQEQNYISVKPKNNKNNKINSMYDDFFDLDE